MMNFGKKFAVGVASAALVASLGGVVAPVAFAEKHSLPGFIAGLDRLSGPDRVATSLAVASHEWGHRDDRFKNKDGSYIENVKRSYRAKRVYLASAEDAHMVDAATAGMLLDGPIVYVTNNVYVGTAVGNFLADTDTNPAFASLEEVVPIGGEKAVAASVAQAVADQIKNKSNKKAKVVTALAGADRYATSVAIAQYMYEASQNKEHDSYKWYGGISGQHTGALGGAYFANGADNHIVDSMVAGTLDNGPILLVQPDGKLPEPVVEFIKKTLPGFFGALGGTGAVPDATVNEAWQVKALANKWDSSYEVPDANKNVRELEKLVYGINPESGDTRLDSKQFAGLKEVIKKAKAYRDTWNNEVRNLELAVESQFLNANKDGVLGIDTVRTNVTGLLNAIYGVDIVKATLGSSDYANFLKGDSKKDRFTGVNYEAIEATKAYQDKIRDPKKELVSMWKSQKQDSNMNVNDVLTQLAAKLSQVRSDSTDVNAKSALSQTSLAGNKDVPLKVVLDLANATVKTDEDWFDYAKTQLGIAKGVLRGELDKIDSKSMLRLGGKDRFETAQLIANQWAKLYAAEYQGHHYDGGLIWSDDRFFEAYVANGTRLPDALTAGQLTRGPILLVRGNEKTKADLPEFTVKVAQRLQRWSDKKHAINMYGIGGKAILADTSLEAITTIANGGTTIEKDADTPGSSSSVSSDFTTTSGLKEFDLGLNAASETSTGFKVLGIPASGADFEAAVNKACANAVRDNIQEPTKASPLCQYNSTDDTLETQKANIRLLDGDKPGKITLNINYKGHRLQLVINVYAQASSTVTLTSTLKQSDGTTTQDVYADLFAEKAVDVALPYTAPATVAEGAKLTATVNGRPATVDTTKKLVKFTINKAAKKGDTYDVALTYKEKDKASTTDTKTVTIGTARTVVKEIVLKDAASSGVADKPATAAGSAIGNAGIVTGDVELMGADGNAVANLPDGTDKLKLDLDVPVVNAKFKKADGTEKSVLLKVSVDNNKKLKFELNTAGAIADGSGSGDTWTAMVPVKVKFDGNATTGSAKSTLNVHLQVTDATIS